MASKTITIAAVIDVVGALAMESLAGQVYFMDTNKHGGSIEQGTDGLKTAVKEGDTLVWTVTFLECEAFAAIDTINIDDRYCKPEPKVYEGTDVTYWECKVEQNIKHLKGYLPYSIKFKLGTRDEPMETHSHLCLIPRE